MQKKYLGSCLCQQIKFEIAGEFEGFFLCHCQHCQKGTGSAHAANLFSTGAQLNWLQGPEKVKTFRLLPTRHTKSFCENCGSALPNYQQGGALLVVPAGCLDTALEKRPDAHIFCASKASWERELEQLPKFDQLPGQTSH